MTNHRQAIKFEPKGPRIELQILKGTEAADFIDRQIFLFDYAISYHVSATSISNGLSCLNKKGTPCQYSTLFGLGHRI